MNCNIFNLQTIKAKETQIILIIFLISLWSLAYYANRMLRLDMQRMLGEQQFSVVSVLAADINSELNNRLKSLEMISKEINPAHLKNQASLQALLESNSVFQLQFNAGTIVIRPDGVTIADVPISSGRIGINYLNADNREFIVEAFNGKSTISRPLMGKRLKTPIIVMATPIRDNRGKVIAVLAGVTSLASPNFLDRIAENRYAKTGGFVIVAQQQRQIITATDKNRIMEILPAPGLYPFIDRACKGHEGTGVFVNPLGVNVLVSNKNIPLAGWYIAALFPTTEAFAPIDSMRHRLLAGTLFLSFLSYVVCLRLTKIRKVRKSLEDEVDDQTHELMQKNDELLESESALRESEERFRSFVENANDIVFSLTTEGVFTYVSPNWKDAFGYELSETIGKPFASFVHPDDIDNCGSALHHVISTGETRKHIEYRVLRKDGTFVWYSANGSLLKDNITGEGFFLGIGRDVTERNKGEQALQESKNLLAEIIELSPISMAIVSMDGTIEQINRRAIKTFGYYHDDIPNMERWWLQAYPDDSYRTEVIAQWMGLARKAIDEKSEIERREYRVTCKDGTVKTSLIFGIPVADKIFVIFDDITERKRAEEDRIQLERQFLQAQKLESLGIMAGGIAHDFNNLLQSILGSMELAAVELAPGSEPQKLISTAMISAKQAANLANLMLAYAGKGFINKKELNLSLLVRENAEIFRSAASTAVSMELSLLAQLPSIIADVAQIQQVVMNLITNAAESIEEQPGNIRLSTGVMDCDQTFLDASLFDEKPEPGLYVFLEVSDNGCGMSKDIINRLFDPFFTTKFTGRGLGMSAVMGIIKSHDGALLVKSEIGKGTTFTALFPATDSFASAIEPDTVKSAQSAPADKPLSGVALIVDDDKSVLRNCSTMVKLIGLRVIAAHNGGDAVSKFQQHSEEIDVIIMDLTMPYMDGITASENIYRIRPDTKIILASGYNKEEMDKRVTDHPPAGFIRKPYSMKELEAEIRKVMQYA
jgi:PAS domain S-box-containing protein